MDNVLQVLVVVVVVVVTLFSMRILLHPLSHVLLLVVASCFQESRRRDSFAITPALGSDFSPWISRLSLGVSPVWTS